MGEFDQVNSAPITPRLASSAQTPRPDASAPGSQLHSPSLSRSPLLQTPERDPNPVTTSTAWRKPTVVISAPPSQFHSPSLSRSPLLHTPDHPVTAPASGHRTPNRVIKSRGITPRFLTPLGSPLRKALHLTKLDPTDAWLPITESRNGNAYYAAFHTLCSGIGIQALILPVAFTILGWAWGIIALTIAFIWQLYTLYLLVHLHESPETGLRYSRYMQLANATFGERLGKMLAMFPIMYLSGGTCVTLIVIGGSTLKMFFQIVCGASSCTAKPLTTVEWYLIFTCAAVILSQLPNLNSIAGVSLIGAITAIGYCTVIWVVSVDQGRLPNVSYNPVRSNTSAGKFFDPLNALGIVAFAFRGHNLVLEIQGTMPSSEKHPSNVPMWTGVKFAYTLIAMCLFPLAIGGYWAYGQMIPNGGMLTALFAFHAKDVAASIQGLASLFVIINALSSFQIYGMPTFDEMESAYVTRSKKPCPWWLRAGMRALFGYLCFFIAVAIPFLASLAGLVGGIALPVTLAYPCYMWLKAKKPKVYSPVWFLNWALFIIGMGLSVLLVIAGLYVLIDTGVKVNFFKPQ